MKTDDLLNSVQNENEDSEINENGNKEENSNLSMNSSEKKLDDNTERDEDEAIEPKIESAADIILSKLKDKNNASEINKEIEESSNNDLVENGVGNIDEKKGSDLVNSEGEKEQSKKKFSFDYTKFSMDELMHEFKRVLDEIEDIKEITDRAEIIKTNFYKRHHAVIEAEKLQFVEKGGNIEAFKPEANPLEENFKAFYQIFKEKKAVFFQSQEKQKKGNLEEKYEIIGKIEELIIGKESLHQTFSDFKDLQKQWHDIGMVPKDEVKKLWETYNYQIEKFYDYVNLNKELRDLDLKKNLERKLDLCQKAEELLLEPKIVSAFKVLQKLHSLWREIGPVPQDKREELWERFKKATATINKKHQEYFENLKKEQQNNLKAKILLCEKIDEINSMLAETPREWEVNSKEIIDLQRLWKLIGFAPKKDNNKIYARFRKACDEFFDAKREFYSKHKEEEQKNLVIKEELCVQAESMHESTDWRKTTDFYIELQKKWKTIGPVPRKEKDVIWQRFRKACNTFFERKSEHYATIDNDYKENLNKKNALIEELKSFEISNDSHKDFEHLDDIQKRWTKIGYVPIKKKDEIQNEFRVALDIVFEKLDLSDVEKTEIKFKTKLDNLKNSPKAMSRIRSEQEKLINKIEKLKSDIKLWENNIGFFAKSKNAEAMIDGFNQKIIQAKQNVNILQKQLSMLNNI